MDLRQVKTFTNFNENSYGVFTSNMKTFVTYPQLLYPAHDNYGIL